MPLKMPPRRMQVVLPAVYAFVARSFSATPTQLATITLARALVQALSSPLGGLLGAHPAACLSATLKAHLTCMQLPREGTRPSGCIMVKAYSKAIRSGWQAAKQQASKAWVHSCGSAAWTTCRALLQPRVGHCGGLPDLGLHDARLQPGAHHPRRHRLLGRQWPRPLPRHPQRAGGHVLGPCLSVPHLRCTRPS